ncbi:MAG: hypothetical protein IBJ16_13890 [Chitinophagaceae bacterium]|nr:hypothetical protein [Chitinophagaceae bacterium]
MTVSINITLKKNIENETKDFVVSRSFDYSAKLAFNTAEAQILDGVVRILVDEIFNRIFSDW